MKVMDNSSIEAPGVGRIVTETYDVEQLKDCHMYVLPSNGASIAHKADEELQMLIEKMGANKLLNNYKIELLDKDIIFDQQPILKQAIEEDKANIIMPLSTPSKFDKQYLIVHTEEKDLATNLPLMIYTSERVTKFSIAEQMRTFAREQPEEMRTFINGLQENPGFLKRYLLGMAANLMHPFFGMAASAPTLKSVLGIKGKITHKDKVEMMENVEKNFDKAHRDNKLDAQITLLIQSADAEDIKKFISSLNKNQQQKFYRSMNIKRTGEEADAWLEVRYEGRIQTGQRTLGRYRLYVVNGKKAELVEFNNRDSFLIHLLYIIDKVISDDVNTMDFDKYKDLFTKLSWEVYRIGIGDSETRYDKITKKRNVDGKFKEKRLSYCLKDIKDSVSESCKKIGVLPSPYYIENTDEHLYVSKNNIKLPCELMNIINKWKNPI